VRYSCNVVIGTSFSSNSTSSFLVPQAKEYRSCLWQPDAIKHGCVRATLSHMFGAKAPVVQFVSCSTIGLFYLSSMGPRHGRLFICPHDRENRITLIL